MKGCLAGTAASALFCAAFIAIAQWVAPALLPNLHLFSQHMPKGPQLQLRPAWPIQRELLQTVQRAAPARGGIFLAVSLLFPCMLECTKTLGRRQLDTTIRRRHNSSARRTAHCCHSGWIFVCQHTALPRPAGRCTVR